MYIYVQIELYQPTTFDINSSHPSAAYILQRIGSAFVQIMAFHLFGPQAII